MIEGYQDTFVKVIEFFETVETKHDFKYAVVGGALVSLYAELRQTTSIDFVLLLYMTRNNLDLLIKELDSHGFQPFTNWQDTFHEWPRSTLVAFLGKGSRIKIDLTPVDPSATRDDTYAFLGKVSILHRQRREFMNTRCWIQSKEDFIIAKLVFQGYQDYMDALSCWIRYNEEMDVARLEERAGEFGVQHLLDAIREKVPVDDVFPDD